MEQGHKTSNRIGTGRKITGCQSPKGCSLIPYSGKKGECGILSCKNDDRHPYD